MSTDFTTAPQPVREAASLTAAVERRLLVWLARRTPAFIHSDHYTALALIAMAGAGVCFRLSRIDPIFLVAVNLCLFLNWFGDSLDGTLARVRDCQRPRYGFYVDHLLDAVGIAALCAGASGSGLATPSLMAVVLVAYLLLSVHIALAAAARGVFRIAYGGVGGTELRILLALVNLTALRWPSLFVLGTPVATLDLAALIVAAGSAGLLSLEAVRTARMLDRTDRATTAPTTSGDLAEDVRS